MLDKFADELREQREKSGLSLQQLANKTRIDLKFLEAIDQGNFAFLPELYVKAFIKQYAKTVGLDETLMIKKFEAAKEGKEFNPNPPDPELVQPQTELPDQKAPINEISKPNIKYSSPLKSYAEDKKQSPEDEKRANNQIMLFGLGSVGVILIAALLYFFVFDKSDKIIVEETPIEEMVENNTQRYEEEISEEIVASDDSLSASSDSLYLTFSAKDTSWVFVVQDNIRTQEFTLNPNSSFTISAVNEFKATVGNSGGITLQLNNKPVDFSGRSGSIRYFKLDKNGLVYLNAPPNIDQ